MIEINLLPVDLRQREGTPLPRLLSILVGALVATLGGVFAGKYYFVDIPTTKQLITIQETEKTKAAARAAEVDVLEKNITVFKEKVAALRNLERSRLRWARFLDRFSKAVPDGVTVRRFTLNPEGFPGGFGTPTGKNYRMEIQCFAGGDTIEDAQQRMRSTLDTFKKEFEVYDEQAAAAAAPPAAGAPPAAPDPLKGYNKFLMMRCEEPRITNFTILDGPLAIRGLPPGAKVTSPARAVDFRMVMWFALPPPEQTQP